MKDGIFYILIFLVMIGLGCEAPRENPLDPFNDKSSAALIEGKVHSTDGYLNSTTVIWKNQNQSYITTPQGYFTFNNIEKKDGWLFFQKDGFHSDSIYVSWGEEKYKFVEHFMDAQPELDSLNFYSIVKYQYIGGGKSKELVARIKVTDHDSNSQIDSVKMIIPHLKKTLYLEYNVSTKFHEAVFINSDIGIFDLDELIGYPFEIKIVDERKRELLLGTTFIKRFINTEILIDHPVNDNDATPPILLRWKRVDLGFPFTYLLQIYNNDFDRDLIWQRGVASSEGSFLIESDIPPGKYYWVVWSVDEFQNRSRSKEARFTVPVQ